MLTLPATLHSLHANNRRSPLPVIFIFFASVYEVRQLSNEKVVIKTSLIIIRNDEDNHTEICTSLNANRERLKLFRETETNY